MIKVDKGDVTLAGSTKDLLAEIGVAIYQLLECVRDGEEDPAKAAQTVAPMIMTSVLFAFEKTEDDIEAPLFPPLGYIGNHKKPKLDKELKEELRNFVKEILKEDD